MSMLLLHDVEQSASVYCSFKRRLLSAHKAYGAAALARDISLRQHMTVLTSTRGWIPFVTSSRVRSTLL